MKGARQIFRFLLDATARGERVALATITGIGGPSPRSIGSHMAVAESGRYLGSFSGGCTEAAVVGEAQRVLASGRGEIIRFGTGSPLIDIRLPCGGAVDFLLSPDPPVEILRAAYDGLARRRPVVLELDADGATRLASDAAASTGWRDRRFLVRHEPDLRLLIVGHGAEASALASLARAYGADALVLTDAREHADSLEAAATEIVRVHGSSVPRDVAVDDATAIVFLLHEHERETDLLIWALDRRPFFIGAMGSVATHHARLQALRQRSVSEAECNRIVGPVGLIAASRDPETLALSILSQIVEKMVATRAGNLR